MREKGYYWVKKNNRWLICRWDGDISWRSFDWEESVDDNEWQEIDENRIERIQGNPEDVWLVAGKRYTKEEFIKKYTREL